MDNFNNFENPAYNRRATKRKMRKRKSVILMVSLLLVIAMSVAGTIAFILTSTDNLQNVFAPVTAEIEIDEEFDGVEKNDVGIKNTGNVDVYVRAAINITWMQGEDASNQVVTAKVPKKDVDYTITFEANSGWVYGGDGFYYYSKPVAPGSRTQNLIKDCKLIDGVKAPDGCNLSVEIVASSIQSTPKSTVESSWNVTIDDNGVLTPGTSEVIGE